MSQGSLAHRRLPAVSTLLSVDYIYSRTCSPLPLFQVAAPIRIPSLFCISQGLVSHVPQQALADSCGWEAPGRGLEKGGWI